MKTLQTNIIKKLEKGEEIAPFLFVGKNTELLNTQINQFALSLLQNFTIPKTSLYNFSNGGENIKVSEIKNFIEKIYTKPNYKFQIFIIENIGNLTMAAANSLLKVLEEPGVGNIIFLTCDNENSIMETILSRVQVVQNYDKKTKPSNNFFKDLLTSYLQNNSNELISYFYTNKVEKYDYINFLETLISYAKDNLVFLDKLDSIHADMQAIEKNNVNPKYIIDKWILTLK